MCNSPPSSHLIPPAFLSRIVAHSIHVESSSGVLDVCALNQSVAEHLHLLARLPLFYAVKEYVQPLNDDVFLLHGPASEARVYNLTEAQHSRLAVRCNRVMYARLAAQTPILDRTAFTASTRGWCDEMAGSVLDYGDTGSRFGVCDTMRKLNFSLCLPQYPLKSGLILNTFKLHCESKKLGHFFTAYNFKNIEQIFTKFSTNQSLFILNIVPEFI